MTPPRARLSRTLNDLTLVAVFALVIAAPLADELAGGLDPAPPLLENRAPAVRPEWSWSEGLTPAFRDGFEAWWNDRFGFRDALVRLDGLVRVLGLGVSPVETAIVGRDGWMYLAESALDLHLAVDPLDDAGVAAWTELLQARQDWMSERGIQHLLVIVPNKHSVYPEHLPDWAHRIGERTRTDQILEHLAAHSDVPWLDLRPVLLEASAREQVYERTDTHWNPRGAWIGYQAIAARLATMVEGFTPIEEDQLVVSEVTRGGGDVARMLGVEPFVEERLSTWELPREGSGRRLPLRGAETLRDRLGMGLSFALQRDDPSLPRAVILRDSFTTLLQPLLAEHFSRTAFVGLRDRRMDVPFMPEIIEAEDPDLVITIVVERMLMGDARVPEGDVRRARDARRFREQGRPVLDAFDLDLAGGLVSRATGIGAPDGLHLSAEAGHEIVLHTLAPAEWERLALVADVTMPEDSTFEVHLPTGEPADAQSLRLRRPLTAGRHRFVQILPRVDLTGPLRIIPGQGARDYVIHTLDLVRGTPRATLPDDGLEHWRSFGAELAFDGDRLALRNSGAPPRLRLPALPLTAGDDHGLLVDLTAPGPGRLRIFAAQGEQATRELRSAGRDLEAGANALFIPLKDLDTETAVRLDPGDAQGTTFIDHLALWSRCDVSRAGEEGRGSLHFRNLEVVDLQHALVMQALSSEPQILLPPTRLPPEQEALLSIDLTVPEDDAAILFFGDGPDEILDRALAVPVKRGRNRLMVPLPAGTLRGSWRFDPGRVPGRYVLHTFELRALPPGGRREAAGG